MLAKNWIDDFVMYASPETGLKRMMARKKVEVLKRSYDAAADTRRTDGWISTSNNANAEIGPALIKLRNRSREAIRNNSIAARAQEVIVSNTIGHGIGMHWTAKVPADADQYNEMWQEWAETSECNYDGIGDIFTTQSLAMRTVVESGGAIVRRVRLSAAENGLLPFRIQILEPDYIDLTKNAVDGFIQGVKYENGRVSGLQLYSVHPGDPNRTNLKSEFVPASECRLIFLVKRPGQVHGIPWNQPVLVDLHELDEYLDASLVKQKVAAAFAGFVHDIEGGGTDDKKKAIGEIIEPGIMEVLPPGKTIEFSNPPSVGDFDPFVRLYLRKIAMGMGITYEALAGDLSYVNFSSGRMGWLEFQRNLDAWRWHMFIPQFGDLIAKWFIEGATVAGLQRPKKLKAVHTPPKREMIDPVSETNADAARVRLGFTSIKAIHRRDGESTEDIFNEIAESNKKIDELGLILDSDPRRTMQSGIVQSGIAAAKIGTTQEVAK